MSNLISLSQQRSFLRGLYLFHGAGTGSRVGFSQAAPILHINEVLKGMFVCKRTVMTLRIDCRAGNPLQQFARTWWIAECAGNDCLDRESKRKEFIVVFSHAHSGKLLLSPRVL